MPKPRRATGRHRTKADPFAKIVGARVRELRKEKEWSFDAFVEEVGLGRGYVSELERGMVVPTITSLEKVARALELSVADLVIGDSLRERLFAATRDLDDRQVAALLKQIEGMLADRVPK